jgi:hypothetical protein
VALTIVRRLYRNVLTVCLLAVVPAANAPLLAEGVENALVESPITCPPRTPPPASHMEKPCGL